MPYVHSLGVRLSVASVLVWAVGCGGGESTKRIAVSGTVRVGGTVLDNAGITFLPLSTTAAPAVSTGVSHGRYRFSAKNGPIPGKYRVVVRLAPPGKDDPPVSRQPTERQSWDYEVEVPKYQPCVIDIELD